MYSSTRWCKILPRKVNIFMWRFFLDKLPHRYNLSSRGLNIQSIVCPICNDHVEHLDHVFFSCDVASNVWRLIHIWSGSKIPIVNSSSDWVSWFVSWHSSQEIKNRVYVIFATTCWILWCFRNCVTFNSLIRMKCDIMDHIHLFFFLFHGLSLE